MQFTSVINNVLNTTLLGNIEIRSVLRHFDSATNYMFRLVINILTLLFCHKILEYFSLIFFSFSFTKKKFNKLLTNDVQSANSNRPPDKQMEGLPSFEDTLFSIYYISKILKDKYNINTSYKLESKGKIAFYVDNES